MELNRENMLLVDSFNEEEIILIDVKNSILLLLNSSENDFDLWLCFDYSKAQDSVIPFLNQQISYHAFMEKCVVKIARRYKNDYKHFFVAHTLYLPEEDTYIRNVSEEIIKAIEDGISTGKYLKSSVRKKK